MSRLLLLHAAVGIACAQSTGMRANAPNSSVSLSGTSISSAMHIVLLLTALAFLPAIITCLTPFLRLSIVFHFLRQALGTQTVPSNQVLLGLSLFLSMIVMQPVLNDIYTNSWKPYEAGRLGMDEALARGSVPVRNYLIRFARESDIRVILEISKLPSPATPQDLKLAVLMPAYVLSELKVGFQIGAVLFLPFLIIDLVVASVTLSLGMVQLPPVMISAPFKILLFVVVDGWSLLVGSLMKGLM